MNRFSIEPMILILNTFFQQNSICEKDNTDYIFRWNFLKKMYHVTQNFMKFHLSLVRIFYFHS